MHSQEGPASGRDMPCRSFRTVVGTTLHSQAWELLSHIPSTGGVDMARVHSQRPSNRTKTV
jgi:hypothetical protein